MQGREKTANTFACKELCEDHRCNTQALGWRLRKAKSECFSNTEAMSMQPGPKASPCYRVLRWAHRLPNYSCTAPPTFSLSFAAARNYEPDCSRLFLEHSCVSPNWKYYLVQPPPFWDWKRRYFVSASHPLKHTGGHFPLTLPTHSLLLL